MARGIMRNEVRKYPAGYLKMFGIESFSFSSHSLPPSRVSGSPVVMVRTPSLCAFAFGRGEWTSSYIYISYILQYRGGG